MKATKKCPECGEPLEGSIKVYLSDVVLIDGRVSTFNIVSNSLSQTDDFQAGIAELVDGAEGDELRIYCPNDHQITLDGELEDES